MPGKNEAAYRPVRLSAGLGPIREFMRARYDNDHDPTTEPGLLLRRSPRQRSRPGSAIPRTDRGAQEALAIEFWQCCLRTRALGARDGVYQSGTSVACRWHSA